MSSQRDVQTSPRTPPSQTSTAKYRPKRGYSRPSIHEAFPDAAIEAPRASESGDERDPHDLSLSPNHAARTSIVDNMLLSLDQFGASDPSVLDDYRLFNSAFETEIDGRYRGHTFSSSVSSEADYGFEDGSGRYATITASKSRRSNSSSNYQMATAPRRVNSDRSQDAMGSRSGTMPRTSDVRKGSKGSSSDYAYTMPRRRTDSGGMSRRSESFDCGPQKYNIWGDPSIREDSLLYDDDAAPTPSVPAGPRKVADYSKTPTAAASRTPVGSRRNSMKSNHAPPSQVRKARQDNIGTGTLKMRDGDYLLHGDTDLDAPPAITASLDPPAPSPTISYNKPAFPQPEPTATITTTTITANPITNSNANTKERPGFFRRVFGSGKASSPSPADPNPSSNIDDLSYLQDNDVKDSTGATANLKLRKDQPPKSSAGTPTKRDGPPQVVKQKSSFFRRRKKSVTDSNVPPPIVLPQELAPHIIDSMKPEPSPVSSLRQVMNPYLDSVTGNRDGQTQVRESVSLHAQRPRESVSAPGGHSMAKQQNLQPFSSSRTQDRSPLADGPDANDQTPGAGEMEPTSSIDSPLQEKSSDVAPTALSPVVEDFSRNLKVSTSMASDGARDSLAGTSKLTIPLESPAASETSHYQTAFNTPVIEMDEPEEIDDIEDKMDGPGEAIEDGAIPTDQEQAQKLFDSQDEVVGNDPAAAWLGDPDRAPIREAYMRLFNWSNLDILAALRNLCGRLVLKGETQQVDRVLDAFSSRWCDCNPSHGFKATGKWDLLISLILNIALTAH